MTLLEDIELGPDSALYNRRIVRLERTRERTETWAGLQTLNDGRHTIRRTNRVPVRAMVKAVFINEWNKGQVAFMAETVAEAFKLAAIKEIEVVA